MWLLAVMFFGAGGAIWVAGIQLSDQTDVLTMRLGLGSALGGLILLAIATNLPEIAIVAAAAGNRWTPSTVCAEETVSVRQGHSGAMRYERRGHVTRSGHRHDG